MRISCAFKSAVAVFSMMALGGSAFSALAKEPAKQADTAVSGDVGPSGLPLPRFVSLKYSVVNVRVGPDQNKYDIAWIYRRKGLPVEITAEYDNWRRIRDADGDQGWVNGAQLAGKRTAMTAPWLKDKSFSMRATPSDDAAIVARVEASVIGNVRACKDGWCELEIKGYRGWFKQLELWGVYPDETF